MTAEPDEHEGGGDRPDAAAGGRAPDTVDDPADLRQPDRAGRTANLAAHCRHLAEAEFRGHCPLYERITGALAEDDELLARIVDLVPAEKVIPVLLNAAVHHLVLGEPDLPLAAVYRGERDEDPWPRYRTLVLDRFDELAGLVRTRSIQTNEVGRAAVLLPALAAVAARADRPLTLVELGPSAGLNLLLDRFGYAYRDEAGALVRAGVAASPVQLRCDVLGPLRPPVPTAPLPLAARVGIDASPVDVTDPDACRWLEACLWPGVPERAERLRAALALARLDPPDLRRGDLVDLLPGVLAAVDPDTVPVVVSTWVLAYLSHEQRARVGDLLGAVGADRPLACITGEYPGVAPWVPRPDTPIAAGDGAAATLVGCTWWDGDGPRADALAWMHAHGRWVQWLDPLTAATRM